MAHHKYFEFSVADYDFSQGDFTQGTVSRMRDHLIIGGGAVGLSLAYELSRHGRSVAVVDRRSPGREASWAGAGLLPPCLSRIGHPALDSMVAMSNRLHEQWSRSLLDETGIDNECRRSGALLLATTEQHRVRLRDDALYWRERDIQLDSVALETLPEFEPEIAVSQILEAYHAPDEVQLRNPRHLQALVAACLRRGVEIVSDVEIDGFKRHGTQVVAAQAGNVSFEADQICICGGAWSTQLFAEFDLPISVRPMRGQIVLLKLPAQMLRHVIYDGPHYLVPRVDGHVLVGSTVEDVGFDKNTTDEAVAEMLEFARSVMPALSSASLVKTWAGLRPATPDGLPYLGPIPDTSNCFVAAGHFRCGLQLSTATAVLMRQVMGGETPDVDLSAFSLQRDSLTVS